MFDHERKFDIRTVERNMKKGIVSKEEYQEYLDSLEDLSSKCDAVYSNMEEDYEDDDEEE